MNRKQQDLLDRIKANGGELWIVGQMVRKSSRHQFRHIGRGDVTTMESMDVLATYIPGGYRHEPCLIVAKTIRSTISDNETGEQIVEERFLAKLKPE
jgi:hypothetical protein